MKLYIVLFLSILLVNCSPGSNPDQRPNPPNSQTKTEIKNQEKEVINTLVSMWDAIEQEDIDRYASFIHPDFTQFGETDSLLRIGKSAEINGVRYWIENSDGIHTEMESPNVTIKGDVAWITYYWKDHGNTNGQPFSSRGKSTRIFVKEDDQWQCIHGHYTLLPIDRSD